MAELTHDSVENGNWTLSAHGGPAILAEDDPDRGPLYRKELAYCDHFVKRDGRGRVVYRLTIDEPLIDHWVKTHREMVQDGVKVPLPIGHTQHPEAKRGDVERFEKEPSENPEHEGEPALFAYIRFKDRKVANQLKDSDVSLYMPHMRPNGKGKIYYRPITHVAITDYPVIPGLGRFKPVAAAFELEEEQMGPYVKLCQKLGIECPEGASEEEACQAIEEAFDSAPGGEHGEENAPEIEEEDDNEYDDTVPGGDEDDPGNEPLTEEDVTDPMQPRSRQRHAEDMEYPDEEEEPPAMSFQAPLPTVVKSVARSRLAMLNSIKPRLTAPVYKMLKEQYCTDQVVAFSLSMEQQGEAPDAFDATVAMFELMPVLATGEKTKVQFIPDEENPVLKDADRRAEAARKARGGR